MKNILDIIYNYSKNGRYIDKNAIAAIVKSYKKEYNIDILKTINIIDTFEIFPRNVIVGRYLDDYIDIYYNRLLLSVRTNNYKSDFIEEDKLNIFEGFFRRNIFIIFNICHEMEHAIQAQIAQKTPLTLEEKLIKIENDYLDNMGKYALDPNKYIPETGEYDISFFEEIKYLLAYNLDNRAYKGNYDISLLERLADLDSMTKLYKMCEDIKQEIPTLYVLLDKLILERKLRDYDNTFISPTTEFFRNITGQRQFYFNDYIDMSLEEKLRLGLPVYTKKLEEKKLILKH